jgi:hypothetical protein
MGYERWVWENPVKNLLHLSPPGRGARRAGWVNTWTKISLLIAEKLHTGKAYPPLPLPGGDLLYAILNYLKSACP